MHADEAVGAKITATRLEGNGYSFDPSHFHGPALSWITARIAGFAGKSSFTDLDALGLRSIAAACGSLVVLLPLLLRRWLGAPGALVGGLILATSPLLCVYSRVFIHEPLLVFFSAIALGCLGWWMHVKSPLAALCGGLALGLMAATKETFAITAFSWMLGLLAIWPQIRGRRLAFATACALGAFLAILLIAYGNPLHFFSTYFVYTTDPAHAKPVLYYWDLVIAPKHRPPQWWTEAGVAMFAAVGAWSGWRRANPFVRVLTVSTVVQFGVYSAISYKTPWLMMVPWMQVCLLAGVGAAAMWPRRFVGMALVGVVVLFQLQQTYAAVFRFPNDTRNPWVYAPTSTDVQRLHNRLESLKKQSPSFRGERIAVLGTGYWPLPWYLRETLEAGYFDAPPEDLESFAVVIAMPEMVSAADDRLSQTHEAFYYGLRNEMPMTVFIRNDVLEEDQ
jgi:uncharacterized protein (TIGR03663 family)